MYQQHFGLAQSFSGDGIAQYDGIFRTEATERLVGELAVALNRKDSVAMLYGNSGTGKSTIAHAVLKDLSTCLAFAALSQRPLSPHELLEQILTDFGLEVSGKSHVERRQIWRQFICEASATDTRVCLLVEDADALDTELLQALHQLTATDASMSPGCNVILTSQSDAGNFLDQPELLALSQRVRLRRRIRPLTVDEVACYIEFKCERAGVSRENLFADDVAESIFDCSGGTFRVIDNILESALALAAANGEPVVSAATITQVADTQFGLRRLEPAEVDGLLERSSDSSSEKNSRTGEIPTLTEFVPAYTPVAAMSQRQPENLMLLLQY